MSIGKYNSECYYDPTAYAALTAVENEERAVKAYRPIVYICSPYSGDVEVNIANARRYCRFAVDAGYIPIAPHLLFPQFLNDGDRLERMLGLHCGNALMSKCAEVWVFGKQSPTVWLRRLSTQDERNTLSSIFAMKSRR